MKYAHLCLLLKHHTIEVCHAYELLTPLSLPYFSLPNTILFVMLASVIVTSRSVKSLLICLRVMNVQCS